MYIYWYRSVLLYLFLFDLIHSLQNILKLKLVPAILSVLYPILCEELDEEDNDEFGQAEANTAAAFAGQVMCSCKT